MQDFEIIVFLLALVSYFVTMVITLRLWVLIKKGKLWIGIPLAVISFAFHELLEIYSIITNIEIPIALPEIFEMSGSLFILYAAFSLSLVLKNVDNYLNDEENYNQDINK